MSTSSELLEYADHHRGAMKDRRDIGLRVTIGIVGFNLLAIKLALDSADHVRSLLQLTWVIRLISVSAWLAMTGMLIQIEKRNRDSRAKYYWAEDTIWENREGRTPPDKPIKDTFWEAVRNSWAGTWPVLGGLGLTIAIWWLAGLVQVPLPGK